MMGIILDPGKEAANSGESDCFCGVCNLVRSLLLYVVVDVASCRSSPFKTEAPIPPAICQCWQLLVHRNCSWLKNPTFIRIILPPGGSLHPIMCRWGVQRTKTLSQLQTTPKGYPSLRVLNPNHNLWCSDILLYPLYKLGDSGWKRLSNLLQVAELKMLKLKHEPFSSWYP